jgi:hypothetical protein
MMTDIRGASNPAANRELAWNPAHPSWREGFRGIDEQVATIVFATPAVSKWIEDRIGWSIKRFVCTARPRAAILANQPGRRQRGIIMQQSPDCRDITRANRQLQLDRDLAVARDPLATLLRTHRGPACQGPLCITANHPRLRALP